MRVEPSIPATADIKERVSHAEGTLERTRTYAQRPPQGAGVTDAPGIHIAGSRDTEPNLPLVDLSVLSALHFPLEPGLLALRLKPEPARDGLFDGVWWPHSRNIHTELPGLVTVLSEHLGRIDRIGLDADAWDGLGEPLFVDGRLMEIDWFPVGDDTIIITRGTLENFALLAISPDVTADEAHATLTMATHTGDTESAQQILIATGVSRPAGHGSGE